MASVWSDRDYILDVASHATSLKDMLRIANLATSGASYRTLRKWLDIHQIDVSNFSAGHHVKQQTKRTLDDYLNNRARISSAKLLLLLVEAGIKSLVCEEPGCGQKTTWNDKPLTLHLDHRDGNSSNNTLKNLRVLCPHCHTQTPTYGFKDRSSNRVYRMEDNFCVCGKIKQPLREKCSKCVPSYSAGRRSRVDGVRNLGWLPKILWPDSNDLVKMLETRTYTSVSEELGVSATAIKKHLRSLGIEPPRKHKLRSPDENRTRDSLT